MTLEKPAVLDPKQHGTQGFSAIATNTQIIHVLFRALINAFAPKATGKKYWRLNIGEETGGLGEDLKDLHSYKATGDLDDTGALKELMKMTEEYIAAQKDEIDACAEALAVKV